MSVVGVLCLLIIACSAGSLVESVDSGVSVELFSEICRCSRKVLGAW